MNLYVTTESDRKLRNVFSNLSGFYIINVDAILSESSLDPTKRSHCFLINSEISRLISIGAKSKRYSGIIYINSALDKEIVESLKKSVEELNNSQIDEIVLLDDYDIPKLKKLYKLFEEVTFFSTLKKTKIIQCTPLTKTQKSEKDDSTDADI
jgi:hypothetical protein